jgi:predicted tellurium resistance membrane protein TerC
MRFIAQGFLKLMEKFKFLANCAFIVIAILGLKLISSIFSHYYTSCAFLESESTNYIMSAITLSVFILPVIYSSIINKLENNASSNNR